jgi:diaminohydroxyphosphoribosylaminopyrimidine deaminase/5-amino-6-(5-phosphoribosylamino)uracil reductase
LVTLKLALSLDGRLAAADGSSRWITGDTTRAWVHRRRQEVDAIVVGSSTVLADDPSLTARGTQGGSDGVLRQPARVIVDGRGRVGPEAKVFDGAGDVPVIVATTEAAPHDRQTAWKEAGAEVQVATGPDGRVDLAALIADLGRRRWIEVLCEGGAGLASALLRRDLVDRFELHHGPLLLGGGPGLEDLGVGRIEDAPRWSLEEVKRYDDDLVAVYDRRRD